jgi:ubiquinone/menaquinone biosynthesis C-methylase UbiE
MPKIKPFEEHTIQYEDWFEQHDYVYRSELAAVKQMIPDQGKGIEIGIGSGRFAVPFGIRYGIEPSRKMIELAARKGARIAKGVAEYLPVRNEQFDFALMVTTICFLDDIEKAFQEVSRILKPGGFLIIGFVDKNSRIGRIYQKNKSKSVFYREATFYSVDEVIGYLNHAGFHGFECNQTIFKDLSQTTQIDPVKNGYGEGSFVVIRAEKYNNYNIRQVTKIEGGLSNALD